MGFIYKNKIKQENPILSEQTAAPKIVVAPNDPYLVYGTPNIVHKKQISSEHGESMTWQTNQSLETGNRPVVAL